MSKRYSRRVVSVTQKMVADWVGGQTSDTVVIKIFDMTENITTVNNAAMTSLIEGLFLYNWTPADSGRTFMVDYWNQTLDAHEYEEILVEAA